MDNLFPGWTRRTDVLRQRIDPLAVSALAATLDLTIEHADGKRLPPGWHWLFFNPVARRSSLGEDGHPIRGASSFLPPVPLPRRMWAGSRIRYLSELPICAEATRSSRILHITNKEGRAGHLCFVTVEHRIAINCKGKPMDYIVEEQDIVYRGAVQSTSTPANTVVAPDVPVQWRERLTPDNTMLFRYSALTFNGHRIHYDQAYARDVEGYRNLVVHGPLTATLLQNFAQICKPQSKLCGFEFKGLSPLFVNETLELQAWCDPDDNSRLSMRAVDSNGALAMEATAHLEDI
ncbi:MaoC family dehydratase N-terminal domain-containing protein [Paraburkholderia sp. RL18-103-BIB-C]|uniref:FAS1-like dehydratase domain-containing protein n=1 Tax=Paraburkholderia sp. RL18-103-BIB-C TaxID=3031637 RepID=UPI0038B73294